MATTNTLWPWTSTAESWVGTPATGDVVMQWQSGDGDPSSGCLEARIVGKNKNPGTSYWRLSGTWASIFGVATNDTVTAVEKNDASGLYKWICSEYTDGTGDNYIGPLEIYDSGETTLIATLANAETSVTATTSWAFSTDTGQQAIDSAYQLGSTSIILRHSVTLRTGNSSSAAVTLRHDTLDIKITYTPYVAPAAITVPFNIHKSKIFQSSIIK